ncbi:MAG TPA: tetratricopeptide repeat protein [Pyrinomonadaceae bacterium]|jgi:TolB-like protein|nr:tetratricopeptide repeat protein [Pyrinomonadaceae bacterium]
MKRCPKCHRTYTDETLNFCLDDGEWLVGSESDEPATAILNFEAPTRVHSSEPKPATSGNIASNKNKLLFSVVCALLVAALGVGGYWLFGNRTGKQINSIAVMPFMNQSGDPNIEYLSDGMTETLISSLTQLPNLGVKPRSTVFRYKGKDTDAKTIGKELNVAAILNGTIVQRGGDMTLHVELIDTASETLLWSADYKRSVANLVALQNEITRDVVDKLKLKLSGADEQKLAKNYTENGEAYQLYLQGRYFWNKQTNKDLDRSIEYFQRAIAIDPNYALAYAGLADAYAINILGASRERMAKSREAALKALSLDDNLAEAHASLGRVLVVDDYDFVGSEREMRIAISLNPNYGIGHHFLGDLLSIKGRFEEAFAEHRRALGLEPFSAVFNAGYGSSLMRARKYDDAAAQFNKALELDPNFWGAYGRLSVISEIAGKYEDCVELRAKAFEANGEERSAAQMRERFAKGGWEGFNRYMTEEHGSSTVPFYFLAVAFTALDEKDRAFDALNKSYENHEISLIQFLNNDERLDPLRNDPRLQDLIKRVGFGN